MTLALHKSESFSRAPSLGVKAISSQFRFKPAVLIGGATPTQYRGH